MALDEPDGGEWEIEDNKPEEPAPEEDELDMYGNESDELE